MISNSGFSALLARLPVPHVPPPSPTARAEAGLQKLALTLSELTDAAGKVESNPTEAQKEVGNYAKGHVSWKGLGLTIETAKGQYRRGVSPDGKAWSTLMKDHYGYVKGTESEADGDHIDIFLCDDDLDSEIVFVVNQVDPAKGKFDEHKVILGCTNAEQAEKVYLRNYEEGWQGLGAITSITLDHFKWWMEHADTSKEIEGGYFAKNLKKPKTAFDVYPLTKIANADGAPYRERAEMYAISPQGVYGGLWDHDKSFAVPGGGVDEGEDIAAAAAREFAEETGMRVKNPRLIPVDPVAYDWSAEQIAQLPPEKQKYRGSRSHFVLADFDETAPTDTKLDQWKAADRGFYSLDDAIGHMANKIPLSPAVHAARRKVLEHLKTLAQPVKQAEDFVDGQGNACSYKPCPECNGDMTSKNENGDTMRGSIRCKGCGHTQPARGWVKQADLLPGVQLRPHQEDVEESAEEPEKRMLLYHALGSGKSLTSLAAAEAAGDPYTAVAPASLRNNYRKEQEKFTDMTTPSNLVSYNAIAKGDVPATDTLIFDEAQRMRNANSQTTQNAVRLADKAKHVYLLSGTPVVNHPHDLVPMIRMLTGKEYSPESFDKQFIDERKISPGFVGWLKGVKPVVRPEMKNKEQFEELLAGHVHHFAPDKPSVEKLEEHYTTEMSPGQTKLYQGFWDQLPWIMRWKMQNDYPMSREELTRLSSFLSGPRQVSLSTLPFMRGKADPYKAYQESPKLQKAVSLMQDALQKDPEARGVAYSNFIDAGLTPYGAALTKAKIPYGTFHGGMNDKARKAVVDDYNSGRIRALLLGPSGGEGISLKGTRLLQILDPHWNSARSTQAVGRGIRYDSHSDLPIQDRNVRVQRFVSHMPKTMWQKMWRAIWRKKEEEDPRRQSPGVDTYLENLARHKDELNDQFLDELKQIGTKQGSDDEPEEEDHPYTIAVDLDGTLAEKEEPFNPETIGKPRPKAKAWMTKFHNAGARLIVFTVRGNNMLTRDWLNENEIPFDFVNENPDQPPDSSGKVFADVYWDDKAINAAEHLDESGPEILALVKAGSQLLHSDEPEVMAAIVRGLNDYYAN